jgi:hypothetical protein
MTRRDRSIAYNLYGKLHCVSTSSLSHTHGAPIPIPPIPLSLPSQLFRVINIDNLKGRWSRELYIHTYPYILTILNKVIMPRAVWYGDVLLAYLSVWSLHLTTSIRSLHTSLCICVFFRSYFRISVWKI